VNGTAPAIGSPGGNSLLFRPASNEGQDWAASTFVGSLRAASPRLLSAGERVSLPLVTTESTAGKRKRGDPNWASGKPSLVPPQSPTEFELEMEKLNLSERTCVESPLLKQWCQRNKNRCYVPEKLLKAWNIAVETDWV
jgi:hypothetical protein